MHQWCASSPDIDVSPSIPNALPALMTLVVSYRPSTSSSFNRAAASSVVGTRNCSSSSALRVAFSSSSLSKANCSFHVFEDYLDPEQLMSTVFQAVADLLTNLFITKIVFADLILRTLVLVEGDTEFEVILSVRSSRGPTIAIHITSLAGVGQIGGGGKE